MSSQHKADDIPRTQPWREPGALLRAIQIARSYKTLVGSDITPELKDVAIPNDEAALQGTPQAIKIAELLFHSPSVILSHNGASDPVFVYGNERALQQWEMAWDELVGLESKYSAPPTQRDDRASMLEEAKRKGYITGYRGTRISKTGRLFNIEGCTLFAVTSDAGAPCGQAATFSRVEYL